VHRTTCRWLKNHNNTSIYFKFGQFENASAAVCVVPCSTTLTFRASWNQLDPLPMKELSPLIGLETLDLGGNQATTCGPEINQLTNLIALDLSFNKLQELPALSSLQNLKILGIEENPLATAIQGKLDINAAAIEKFVGLSNRNDFSFCTEKLTNIPYPSAPSTVSSKCRSKIFGCIIGGAIGDSLGLATEFLEKYQANLYYGASHLKYSNFIQDR